MCSSTFPSVSAMALLSSACLCSHRTDTLNFPALCQQTYWHQAHVQPSAGRMAPTILKTILNVLHHCGPGISLQIHEVTEDQHVLSEFSSRKRDSSWDTFVPAQRPADDEEAAPYKREAWKSSGRAPMKASLCFHQVQEYKTESCRQLRSEAWK